MAYRPCTDAPEGPRALPPSDEAKSRTLQVLARDSRAREITLARQSACRARWRMLCWLKQQGCVGSSRKQDHCLKQQARPLALLRSRATMLLLPAAVCHRHRSTCRRGGGEWGSGLILIS